MRHLWNTVIEKSHIYGSVVQMVRTSPCHGEGRGFEPHSSRQLRIRCYEANITLYGKV